MNFAHLHLLTNHVPLIGIPIALLFLGHGLWTKNGSTQKFSLLILIGLAAMVLPIFLTGEPAEEIVESLPGVAKSLIELHEDAALISLVLTLITGASALVALWFQKDESRRRVANLFVVGIATISLLSLAYTANLGGKIRHSELRGEVVAPADGED